MPQTINEILAGRDVICYLEPYSSSNTFPGNNPWGTAPGGSWIDEGWTKDGVAVRWRQQIQTYMVDQSVDPVTALPLSRDLRFQASLGQVDMYALVASTSAGSATGVTAPGSGTADFILQSVAQNLYYSVFFDVRNPLTNDFAHFVGWFTRGVGDQEIRVHLPDLAQVNVEMQAFPDTSTSPARVAQFRIQMG